MGRPDETVSMNDKGHPLRVASSFFGHLPDVTIAQHGSYQMRS